MAGILLVVYSATHDLCAVLGHWREKQRQAVLLVSRTEEEQGAQARGQQEPSHPSPPRPSVAGPSHNPVGTYPRWHIPPMAHDPVGGLQVRCFIDIAWECFEINCFNVVQVGPAPSSPSWRWLDLAT